jgi:large subunit ribosomal protein L3
MKMAGQTGNARVTQSNLQILKVLTDKNLILVKGSIPGAKGSYVLIKR